MMRVFVILAVALLSLRVYSAQVIINVTNNITGLTGPQGTNAFYISANDSVRLNVLANDGVSNINFTAGGGSRFRLDLFSTDDQTWFRSLTTTNTDAPFINQTNGEARFVTRSIPDAGNYQMVAYAIPVIGSNEYPIAWHNLVVTNPPASSSGVVYVILTNNYTVSTTLVSIANNSYVTNISGGAISNVFLSSSSWWVQATGALHINTNTPVVSINLQGGLTGSISSSGELTLSNTYQSASGGGGATGLVLIAEYVASNTANTVTFTIPTNYHSLRIESSIMEGPPYPNAHRNVNVRFNGDTNANYVYLQNRNVNGTSGSAVDYQSISMNVLYNFSVTSGMASCFIDIPDYQNTSIQKGCGGISTIFQNNSGSVTNYPNYYVSSIMQGLWRSSAAITSINISTVSASNMFAGTIAVFGRTH